MYFLYMYNISMVEIKGVTKTYGKKDNLFKALDNVSATIKDSTTVAITGKSGSGKSTLMHVISGLDHATSGEVIINNKPLHSMNKKEVDKFRSDQIGFIFQAFFIEGNQTCLNNVMLPLEIAGTSPKRRVKLAKEALKSVDLEDKINQKAKNLSGGQKQRLAIARAIVNKPKLIFADEPTGNLDSVTGNLVTKLLFDLNKSLKATLIIVTHDKDLASKCSQQIILKDGKIISNKLKKRAKVKK